MIRLLTLLLFVGATAPADALPALEAAEQALAEGIPQVAIVKLKGALAQKNLAAADRERTKWLLAEAQLAAGNVEEARASLGDLPERKDTTSILLRANIDAAAGQWGQAFGRYQEV